MVQTQVILKKAFKAQDINIKRNKISSRKIDPVLENKAKSQWEEIVKKSEQEGTKIWDGTYYRLDNVSEIKNGSNEFKLSTIKYSLVKAYRGLSEENNLTEDQYTYHINTGGLIKTTDNFYIFGNKGSDFNNPIIDFIGGGLQEDELIVETGNDIERNVFKEIKEEVNLEIEEIKESEIIGILLAKSMAIIIIFEVDLKLTKEEVQIKFDERVEDEIKSLVFVPEKDIKDFFSKQSDYRALVGELLD
jgi:hypothetical protein